MPSSFLAELLVPLIKTWLICNWYLYRLLQCLFSVTSLICSYCPPFSCIVCGGITSLISSCYPPFSCIVCGGVTSLICSFCPLIVVLSVGGVTSLICSFCPPFSCIICGGVTSLICSYCPPFSCSVCGNVTSLICSYCPPFSWIVCGDVTHWFVHNVPLFLQCLRRCDVTDLFLLSPFFLQCLWRCHAADPQFKSSATWKVHLEEKRHHDKHHPGQSKMTSASLNKLIQSKHDSSVSLSKFTQKSSLLKKRRGFSRAASISDRHGSCQSIPEFPEKCTSGQMCTSVAS